MHARESLSPSIRDRKVEKMEKSSDGRSCVSPLGAFTTTLNDFANASLHFLTVDSEGIP
jgi:hypothetical protein